MPWKDGDWAFPDARCHAPDHEPSHSQRTDARHRTFVSLRWRCIAPPGPHDSNQMNKMPTAQESSDTVEQAAIVRLDTPITARQEIDYPERSSCVSSFNSLRARTV